MTEEQRDTCQRLAVYYDGACPLCRREIGVYQSSAGAERIAWVNVADEANALPEGLDPAAALARFHVRTAEGRLVGGAEAFGRLWMTLPRWRWLGRIVLLPGVTPVAELAYRAFLRIRPRVQALVARRVGR